MGLPRDVCLLGLDPRSGRVQLGRLQRDLLVGAAILSELEQLGVLTFVGSDAAAEVVVDDQVPPSPALADPVLAAAVRCLHQRKRGVVPQLISDLSGGAWRRQVELLHREGVLSQVRRRPTFRCTFPTRAPREAVVRRVRAVLLDGAEADRSVRRLIVLLDAAGRLPLVVRPDQLPQAVETTFSFLPDPVAAGYREASWVTASRRVAWASGTGS